MKIVTCMDAEESGTEAGVKVKRRAVTQASGRVICFLISGLTALYLVSLVHSLLFVVIAVIKHYDPN